MYTVWIHTSPCHKTKSGTINVYSWVPAISVISGLSLADAVAVVRTFKDAVVNRDDVTDMMRGGNVTASCHDVFATLDGVSDERAMQSVIDLDELYRKEQHVGV